MHRGGTTFVQRLLNCHREVVIWGEHAGIVRHLLAAYQDFAASQAQKVDVESYIGFAAHIDTFEPWANRIDSAELLEIMSNCVARMFEAPGYQRRWGFKEIRYNNRELIAFLLKLFPHARLVLVYRNPVDTFMSQILARWTSPLAPDSIEDAARSFLQNYNDTAATYLPMLERTDRCTSLLSYDTLHADPAAMDSLWDFLDLDPTLVDREMTRQVREAVVGSSYTDASRPGTDPEYVAHAKVVAVTVLGGAESIWAAR